MMETQGRLIFVCLAAIGAFGCAAADGPQPDDAAVTSDQQELVLDEIKLVDGGTIRFVRFRGDAGWSPVFIEEERSAYGSSPVVELLLDEHSDLTNLEVFHALSPRAVPMMLWSRHTRKRL